MPYTQQPPLRFITVLGIQIHTIDMPVLLNLMKTELNENKIQTYQIKFV